MLIVENTIMYNLYLRRYFWILTPKELVVFLEFQLGSYCMSLEPIFFIFVEQILLFEIYSGM